MKNQKISIFLVLAALLLFAKTIVVTAQVKKMDSVKTVAPIIKNPKRAEADSLINVITNIKADYEKVLWLSNKKDSILSVLDEKNLALQNANTDMTRKLSNFKGENLKLDQSNRILIIFNTIVGILLLSTLVWFLRNIGKRKASDKNQAEVKNETNASADATAVSYGATGNQYFENKLEQLEKLGKLREKGILNDEEFNRQKLQVLGNNS